MSPIRNSGKSTRPQLKSGQDLQYLRSANLHVLLSAIWDHGPISRYDLAHLTGLAPSSITRLIQELSQLGLVKEIGKGESSGGRLPVLIAPNPDAGLVISLDLSGPHLRGGIFDAANTLLSVFEQPFYGLGAEPIRQQVVDSVHFLRNDPAARGRQLLAIGVSQPGTIDLETGVIQSSFNLQLRNFPLRKILNDEFVFPVYIEHDASVAALAEQYYGAGRGLRYLVYVLVSTGIGSGVILDGRIYRGELGMSGEFGHINVDPGGPLCVCGKRGCLEAVAAVPAILNGARRMIAYGRASFLSELCDHQPDQLTIEMISQAAEQQDPVARDLLSHSADRLAQGITTYASLFDISHFIIGGEVIDTGEAYFGLLELALRKYCRDDLKVEILRAQLEKNAFLRGISMLTLQEVLRDQLGRFR